MPKYFYRCTDCNYEFEIYHSMKECLDFCDQCELKTLIRVPSLVYTNIVKKNKKTKKVVGSVVKEFIEDTKQQLKSEKQMLKKENFES